MNLDNFAFVHYSQYSRLKELILCEEDSETIKKKINQAFVEAIKNEKVFFSNTKRMKTDKDQAEFAWFRTPYYNVNTEQFWMKFEKNKREGCQKWFFAEFISQSDMYREIVSTQYFVIGEMIFSDATKGNDFLEKLKTEAQAEEWSYFDYKSSINYPILKSYVEHTYIRLKNEGKIIKSKDNKKIILNIGLLDKNFLLDICILCNKIPLQIFDQVVFFSNNPEIVLEDDISIIKNFSSRPLPAKYFSKIDEVIFNPNININMNWKHIFIERADRIPVEIRNGNIPIKEIVQRFRGNEENIKKMARRNYRMVIPQFYNDEIQFLMPIYLGTDFSGEPDFILVLAMDNSGNDPVYIGTTILTVEMAYQNARLITKPDNSWLVAGLQK